MLKKTNVFYPLTLTRSCEYQSVGNVRFLANFANVLNDDPRCQS